MSAYADGPVGAIRALVQSEDGITAHAPGDPAMMAAAIIESVSPSPAPTRLTLGSDAYDAVRHALASRLEELEAAKQTALSTDVAATG
ncbi:hypothetical protein ACJ6WF_39725 [Streptomyces sp. MMS24-I2-30]|uniref:hypothetical protein n=1 Tax=Streptomyces sp. MMS24-I2-30 TaxID=3351564 RepID=UPI0038968F0C